jgi:LmbE family N-acetylglucosaminyl deacetylase
VTEPPGLDLRRVLVVSPHLDDAVFSCAHLLAGADDALVITVFAGAPDRYPDPLGAWDVACGFRTDDDVVTERRREDEDALRSLGRRGEHLDFVDRQYRTDRGYDVAAISRRIGSSLEAFDPTVVLAPLAIQHPDHRAALRATLALRARNDPSRVWAVYGEYPYVWREQDRAVRRLAHLRTAGYRVTPVLTLPRAPDAKARALRSYRSQLAGMAFDAIDDVVAAPEQIWRLDDKPNVVVRGVRYVGYRTGVLHS